MWGMRGDWDLRLRHCSTPYLGPQHRSPCLGGAGCEGTEHGQQRRVDDPCHVYRINRVNHLPLLQATREPDRMRRLREQPSPSEPPLPPLRQHYLKRPQIWLTVFAALTVLTVADTFRSPSDQITGRLYVDAVRVYQAIGRPLLRGHVRCRYKPSCSEYSIQAVQTHGIRKGLVLTRERLASCQTEVPLGTPDPVPPPE